MTVEIDTTRGIKSGVNHYTYRVEWSPDDGEYIGRCIELPTPLKRAPSAHEALTAITAAADEYLNELQECLALEAAEQRVSMNQWVVQKLSGRELRRGLGAFGFD